ncbi:MAG: ATP-binding protein [Chitinophagales bacterium]
MEENSPFKFGNIARRFAFVNREEEIERLLLSFRSSISVTLISPRRWGKSSLVAKAGEKLKKEDKNFKVVYIDLFGISSREEFYGKFASEVIKSTENNIEGWMRTVKDFLGKISPKISFSPNQMDDFSIGFDWSEKINPDDILSLPEKIAVQKKIKILVCIDEFQNISEFNDHKNFQKKLRANWQQFDKTSFCLYGSKRNLMSEFFNKQSMPFYRFGELMFLEKIEEKHWLKFIVSAFKKTGKKIGKEKAMEIARLMENHPYYVQQLSHNIWVITANEVDDREFEKGLENMLYHNAILYQRIVEDLSAVQIQLLKAICKNEKHLYSKDTIKNYNLGTSANVNKAKKALEDKQVIDTFTGEIELDDPAFALWFKRFFMKMKLPYNI